MLTYHLITHLTPLQLVHTLRAYNLTASNGTNVSRDNCKERNAIFNPITVHITLQMLWETCGLDFLKNSSVIRQKAMLPAAGDATLTPPRPTMAAGATNFTLSHPLLHFVSCLCPVSSPHWGSPDRLNPNPSSSTRDFSMHGSLPGGKRQVII